MGIIESMDDVTFARLRKDFGALLPTVDSYLASMDPDYLNIIDYRGGTITYERREGPPIEVRAKPIRKKLDALKERSTYTA